MANEICVNEKGRVLCPECRRPTRVYIAHDTYFMNLPLYCPKCGHERKINRLPKEDLWKTEM